MKRIVVASTHKEAGKTSIIIGIAKALSSILDDVEGQIVAVLGAGHIDGVTKALIRIIETRATD